MITATCGHKCIDAIVTEVRGFITQGSYCAECILDYYRSGRLLNRELIKLIKITGGNCGQ